MRGTATSILRACSPVATMEILAHWRRGVRHSVLGEIANIEFSVQAQRRLSQAITVLMMVDASISRTAPA